MISFLCGIVHSVFEHTVWINVNGVGYEISVSRTSDYKEGNNVFVYTVDIFAKETRYLVGFLTQMEKSVFMALLKVNGIGPKTALGALNRKTPEAIVEAIRNNDIKFLKEIPCIGQKSAQQILIDLKGKIPKAQKVNLLAYDDAFDGLKSLGFNTTQINNVLSKINTNNLTSEEIIKIALSKLGS